MRMDARGFPRAEEYPRVLLVNVQAFNRRSGPGITLTNLFRGWPADRIAMVHGDPIPTTHDVCRSYYRLGDAEMAWAPSIAPLVRLQQSWRKTRRAPSAGRSRAPGPAGARPSLARRVLAPVTRRIYVGDIVRRFQVSASLRAWIAAFRPELIYVQLATLTYMHLVEDIQRMTGAPLAIHFMDDWPTTLHDHPLVRPFLRARTTGLLRALLAKATVRAGISEQMAREYERRYGYPFLSFHNPIDPAICVPLVEEPDDRHPPFRLVFAGTLNPLTTLEAVGDVCDAVTRLRREGLNVEFELYGEPRVLGEGLQRPGVRYAGYITGSAEVARMQARADVLMLPLSFAPSLRRFLALSMPTKTTSYMASGTPILVYAPPDTALAEYARESGWASVVSRRSTSELARAIRRLCTDRALRQRLRQTAYDRVMAKHTLQAVTGAFHRALVDGARRRAS
jgi:glycosyltransferase involved in cell wall biosynthesis